MAAVMYCVVMVFKLVEKLVLLNGVKLVSILRMDQLLGEIVRHVQVSVKEHIINYILANIS